MQRRPTEGVGRGYEGGVEDMRRKVQDTDVKGKKKGGKLHWKNSLVLQKIDRVRSGEKYFKTFCSNLYFVPGYKT